MAQRNGLISAVVCALLAVIVSAPAAGAAAGSAFVRVNQLGYPLGAPKRAFLMSSADRPGTVFHVVDASGRTVLSGQVGASTGSWSDAYPSVRAIDFSALRRAGTFTITVGGPVAATSPPFRIGTGSTVYSTAIANARRFYEVQRDGADYVPSALRTAPGHLNDEHAMTYLTPKVDGDGIFEGDLTPLGKRIDASGGWWDAGDYLEVPARDQLHRDDAAGRRARLPRADGRRRGRRATSRARCASGPSGCCGCGTTARAPSTTRWASARGTTTRSATTTSGGCPRTTTRTAAPTRCTGTSATGRCSARGRRDRRSAPTSRAATRAAFALCYQVFHRTQPALRPPLSARRRAHLRARRHAAHGPAADGDPVRLLPGDRVARRPRARRHRTGLAPRWPPGRRPASLPGRAPTRWARAYMEGPDDAADTLNLYDVSGLAHYELYRAIGQRARSRRLRDHPAGAAGRHAQGARPGGRPEHDRPVRVRVRLGAVGHHDARRRALGDGQRVRPADRHPPLRGDRHRLARRHPRGERLGLVADHRRRHRVPALHAAPGGEHRRVAGRVRRRCWPAPRWRGRTATRRAARLQHMRACPGRRRRPLRAVQRTRPCSRTTSSRIRPSSRRSI